MPSSRPRRRAARRSRLLPTLIRLGIICGAVGGGALWGATLWLETRLPEVLSVEDYRRTAVQMSRAYDADGVEIGRWWVERRTLQPGERIPRHVRLAAVAAEDGDFYTHSGLDYPGIVRAIFVNLRDGRFSQGASTITQQVARTFYLTGEKTLARKAEEAFLALKLDRHLAKDEILELYLNQIYFGGGNYGIVEAARHYLDKPVAALTVADGALLMALVPAPERLNPFVAKEACLARRDRILDAMVERGFLSPAAGDAARDAPVFLAAPSSPEARGPSWFLDVVRARVERSLGRSRLLRGGLQIHTTYRAEVQGALDDAVRKHLDRMTDAPQLAAVIMAPSSREVLAMVGGRPDLRSDFNRAVLARRQAGSTLKPLVYGAGIEAGLWRPDSTFANVKACYPGAGGRWCPGNADDVHDGAQVTLAAALARSLNVVAVAALSQLGLPALTDFARRLGLRAAIPHDLTAALGSVELTPLDLANAYATLAASGAGGRPVFVRRVEDPRRRVVYSESSSASQSVPAEVADAMTELLLGVVGGGTGHRARIEGVRVAGKTGTTSRGVDAWFVGYTDTDLLAAIWLGHDDGRPMADASGGRTAAPLWRDAIIGAGAALRVGGR